MEDWKTDEFSPQTYPRGSVGDDRFGLFRTYFHVFGPISSFVRIHFQSSSTRRPTKYNIHHHGHGSRDTTCCDEAPPLDDSSLEDCFHYFPSPLSSRSRIQ
jgi:hypothetical protein